MAEQVCFRVDHHQLTLVVGVMNEYLSEPPRGELHNFLHSIIAQQRITLERKLLLRKQEYRIQMPVHFGLAFRRMVGAGLECVPEGNGRTALRMLMAEVDPVLNRFLFWH